RVLIAQLDGIGRDIPLSAEKLSPILAFYSAPNLAASIDVCVRLLLHGGAGHTASIHSQSEAAVKQYGLAVPAFRIAVNTSSVHGSIGYSTNLFPAMTLGCGSPGGNITSDNIGPEHLMNVKRVAWESRPIEHRTVPADQRLAAILSPASSVGAALRRDVSVPVAVARAARVTPTDTQPSVAATAPTSGFPGDPSFASSAKGGDVAPSATLPPAQPRAIAAAAGAGATTSSALSTAVAAAAAAAPVPDRQTIARIVEQVFTSRGILRRSATPSASPELRQGTASALPKLPLAMGASAPEAHAPKPTPAPIHPLPPPVEVAEFLSENDVRMALTRNLKLYIGPKTILTPSASDLGREHDIFIITDIVPTPKKRRFES
ncbi:MAG: hypothetical protein WB987_15610, partial [Candidatus Acidiferrales bacterium]